MPENETWQFEPDWQAAPDEPKTFCKETALMRAKVYTLCAYTSGAVKKLSKV